MIERLDQALKAVCPIHGVAAFDTQPPTYRIDFKPEATDGQRTAAQSALAAFDWSQAADDAWREDQKPERKTLRQAAVAAVNDIDTYLAIASPTNAQVAAQVKRLSQQNRAIIRRLIQLD